MDQRNSLRGTTQNIQIITNFEKFFPEIDPIKNRTREGSLSLRS